MPEGLDPSVERYLRQEIAKIARAVIEQEVPQELKDDLKNKLNALVAEKINKMQLQGKPTVEKRTIEVSQDGPAGFRTVDAARSMMRNILQRRSGVVEREDTEQRDIYEHGDVITGIDLKIHLALEVSALLLGQAASLRELFLLVKAMGELSNQDFDTGSEDIVVSGVELRVDLILKTAADQDILILLDSKRDTSRFIAFLAKEMMAALNMPKAATPMSQSYERQRNLERLYVYEKPPENQMDLIVYATDNFTYNLMQHEMHPTAQDSVFQKLQPFCSYVLHPEYNKHTKFRVVTNATGENDD